MIKTRRTTVLPVIMSTEPKLFAAWLKKNLGAKVARGKVNGEVIYFITFRPNESYVLVEAKALNTRAGVLTILPFRNGIGAFEKLFPLPTDQLPSTEHGVKVYKIWSGGKTRKLIAYIRVQTNGS